jgi:hypothetical protein
MLAEQNDEWTEPRRYMGVKTLAACPPTLIWEKIALKRPDQTEIDREVAFSCATSKTWPPIQGGCYLNGPHRWINFRLFCMLVIALIAILAFFAVAQLRVFLIAGYTLTKGLATPAAGRGDPQSGVWPTVVVQLPVCREHASFPRLLDAVLDLIAAGRNRSDILGATAGGRDG